MREYLDRYLIMHTGIKAIVVTYLLTFTPETNLILKSYLRYFFQGYCSLKNTMNTRLILLFLTFFVAEFSTLELKCRICQEAFIEESCNEYPELQMHGCKVVNTYFLPSKLSGS